MRTKLLIALVSALLAIPSAAFADERAGTTDAATDVAVRQADESDRAPDREQDERPETDVVRDERPVRDVASDREIDRRCLDADVVSDRCCLHVADEHPERCRHHICQDTDVLTDRCCLHFAQDHPERCRDREIDTINYRTLFWRAFHAGNWQLIIRLLNHLHII